ncbi:MAG: hypothetical protein HW421_3421 [Ignavibacteria bacterium]|nr:hypothetical protein [Ignavibacteria bacterium]
MKILVINWQCIKNPMSGGAEVHLHEIFKRIAAHGHSVTLFCCSFEGSLSEENIDGIRVIRKGGRSLFNFYVPAWYKKYFSKQGYDVIIDDINKIPFYTPLYIKEPLIGLSHHFFGKSIFREAGLISASYVYFSEKLMDYIYKKIPFVVVSESTKSEFLERGYKPANFSIVGNAITQSEFPMAVGEKEEVPVVAYFGRLKKYKSVDHLFYAFAKVSEKIPEIKLYIMGRGSFQPELERLSVQLGISGKVTFFGFVSEEDKKSLLSKSWCMVNTSMKEGWGITNIEANACGTAVISSDVPGLRDSVNKDSSGLLYEYGNIDILAQKILDVITNEDLRQKLSEGAVKWAKSFSWDVSAEKMIEVCRRVIEVSLQSEVPSDWHR